jgi:MYXO-CTERM domain-containing protein
LQGVNSFASTFTKVATTTTGTESKVMTTNTNQRFAPGVVIFGSDASNNAAQVAPSSKANFMFSAASSTTKEEAVSIACEHAAANMECESYDSAENLILIHENTFDATDTTDNDEAEASLQSLDAFGFTVNWSKQDNHATIWPYLAMGTPYGTDVKLESFDVVSNEQGRSFRWRTGYESSSLGFHIYDSYQGKRRLLTPELIAGSALLVGAGQPVSAGRSYQWQTGPDLASTQYWLEEVSVDGTRTSYGPYVARRGPSPNVGAISSPLLVDLGHDSLLRSGLADAGDTLNARDEGQPRPGRIPQPDDLAARPGLAVTVRKDGFFRLGADRLIAAGLDPAVDPRRLRLYADGYEVRMRVVGEEDGRLDPGDAVEFYGLGNDTLFTDGRVYWLAEVGGEGPRLGSELGPPQRSLRVGSFPFTVEDRARSIYFAALLNDEGNNFFGPVVSDRAVERHVAVHHLSRGAGGAQLKVRLQGASETAHRVTVQLNGQPVGQLAFQGRAAGEALLDVPGESLADGDNVVSLVAASSEDVVLFDSLRLTYPHGLVADDDAQRVTLPARRGVKLDGFTTDQVRAFDVTSPDAVIELPLTRTREGDTVSAAVSPLRNGGTVLFVGERRVATEATLRKNQPSNWRGLTAGADLLILTHGSLAPAVEPLRRLREAQGLTVQVIDVEDLYDEFNHGEKDPRAIRAFLQTAVQTFSRKPRFVLLVGDASFDPRDYLGLGDHDLVPTKLVDTWPLETASDDWFVDFADRGVPQLAIGRLPARTLEGARAIVDKLVRHDSLAPQDQPRALVISDENTTGNDFEGAARQAAAAFPPSMPVSLRFRGQPLSPSDPPTLFDAINSGPSVIEYFGHGSVDLWNGTLSADAVAGLANRDQLSLVVSMTCLNGFFQDARTTTMAEALLGAPQGGAFAVWASSGYTSTPDQRAMGDGFVRAVLQEGLTLGEAALKAKAEVSDLDVRRTWMLFGDPSQSITRALKSLPDPTVSPGCAVSPRSTSTFPWLLLMVGAALFLRRRRR